ncbi:Ig-like domain-containing protein [Bradyrhizobium sp. RDM12]
MPISVVSIWDSNGGGSYEFSNASDGKPQEAAAWAKYFGATPTIPSLAPLSTDNGLMNVDQITLSGTAEAGNTVEVFDGAKLIGTAVADANGAWSFATSVLADGAHSFSTKAVNAVGNVSAASGALAVTIDTVAPIAPKIVSDTRGSSNTMVVVGTAEAGSKIVVYEGATLLGSGVADAQGNWNVQTISLAAGVHNFVAAATDAAGNVSQLSNVFDPVIGTVIESVGSVSLVQVGKNYYLSSFGTDLVLKYGGNVFVAGQFGAWVPLGVEATATGYDVAWKNTSTGLYTVWSVDKSGNFASDLLSSVSGSSTALQSIENLLQQDLNGNDSIGAPVAQSAGTTITKTIEFYRRHQPGSGW